jgi:hypothetical protein
MNFALMAYLKLQWYEPSGNLTLMISLASITFVGGIIAVWKAADPTKGRQYCWAYGYFYLFTIAFAAFYHFSIEWTIKESLLHVLITEGHPGDYKLYLADSLRSLAVSDMFCCIIIAIGAIFGLLAVLRIRKGEQVMHVNRP